MWCSSPFSNKIQDKFLILLHNMIIPFTGGTASIVFANYFSIYIANIFNFGLLKREEFGGSFFFSKGESTDLKKSRFVCCGCFCGTEGRSRDGCVVGRAVASGDHWSPSFHPGSATCLLSWYSLRTRSVLGSVSQVLHLICSSNGPVRWVLLSSHFNEETKGGGGTHAPYQCAVCLPRDSDWPVSEPGWACLCNGVRIINYTLTQSLSAVLLDLIVNVTTS